MTLVRTGGSGGVRGAWSSTRSRGAMSRRHFLSHAAGAAGLALPAWHFSEAIEAHAADLGRRHKSAILLWMGGGPSTIDLFDLKPGSDTGGPFQPIATTGEAQICEHLPLVAQQMRHLSVIRSMSTREADHNRGRYAMHTGYAPIPEIVHPSYGAVVSHELAAATTELEIPPFVSVGGASEGPGFLGMAYAPFAVDSNGQVRDLETSVTADRLAQRMRMLAEIEGGFVRGRRGEAAAEHAKILEKTRRLLTSDQMVAFRVDSEPAAVREQYGENAFGRGCLMARRLVEAGVAFVEVDLGGWDNHQGIFPTLQTQLLPTLDRGLSALVADLVQRGLWEDTAVVWMGEFGRTPRINTMSGRDHWARGWSVVAGGAGMAGGRVIGRTSANGTEVETTPYSAQDLMASVLSALGISLDKTFTSRNGRPMKIANGGRPIDELLAT